MKRPAGASLLLSTALLLTTATAMASSLSPENESIVEGSVASEGDISHLSEDADASPSSARPNRRQQHRSSRRKSSSSKSATTGKNTCTLYLAPTHASEDNQDEEDNNNNNNNIQTPISMGVYAGVDLPANTPLGHTDMVLPIVEIWSHIMHRYSSQRTTEKDADGNKDYVELQTRDALDVLSTGHHGLDYHMSSLLWEPHHLGGAVTAGHGYDSKALSPGLGSLVRSAAPSTLAESHSANEEGDSPRDNTEMKKQAEANIRHGRVHSERDGVQRTDPAAGSFTYYHGLATYTTTDIEAGSELYADFGEHYYSNTVSATRGAIHQTSSISGNNFHDDEVTIPAMESKIGNFMSSLWGVVQSSAIGSSLPNVLQKVVDDSSCDKDGANDETHGRSPCAPIKARPATHHAPEWLAEKGRCLDTIRPAKSTIAGAGRGAFANHHIASGEVIAPAPMVHIADRSLLDIREPLPPLALDDQVKGAVLSETVVGKQLLLNYCMGHNASTMLLCSVGAGTAYINHALEPNAELRWSTRSGLHNTSWLERSPDDLDGEQSLGLMMEYVATRPIMPGEEIFVNYGNEWEAAWKDHLTAWNPDPDARTYVDASLLNKVFSGMSLLTLSEQIQTPFPRNIHTSCYYHYVPEEVDSENMGEGGLFTRQWVASMESDGYNLRSCRLLQRHEHENGMEDYTVRVLNNDETHHGAKVPNDLRLIVTNVPRDAIVFTDRMYTTDQHLPTAFRHEAAIPDHLMPEAWKNKS